MKSKFLIKNPLVTEKGVGLSQQGKYLFLVGPKANKSEIRKGVEAIYKVKVTGVNIVNVKPKSRRLGRTVGKKPGYKKAIVTLAPGQKLDVVPQ